MRSSCFPRNIGKNIFSVCFLKRYLPKMTVNIFVCLHFVSYLFQLYVECKQNCCNKSLAQIVIFILSA
jgi:hypothetical protein